MSLEDQLITDIARQIPNIAMEKDIEHGYQWIMERKGIPVHLCKDRRGHERIPARPFPPVDKNTVLYFVCDNGDTYALTAEVAKGVIRKVDEKMG